MDEQAIDIVVEAFKEEEIDLVVTLPEEPTYSLTERVRSDPYFEAITVVGEGHGIALCAGASLGGRHSVFITGVAGLQVAGWALAQTGVLYGIPLLILASYRGDFGDNSGISGPQLHLFRLVAEPLLRSLRIPYGIADRKQDLKQKIRESHFSCRQWENPSVLFLTGEVLW